VTPGIFPYLSARGPPYPEYSAQGLVRGRGSPAPITPPGHKALQPPVVGRRQRGVVFYGATMAKRTSKKKSKKTCGDFGGKNTDGTPCGRAAGWGLKRKDGKCRDHSLGGRPRKISDSSEFDRLTDEYIERCRENSAPITWTGLALYLGFSSRQAIDEYASYEGFSDSVKRAKLLVENAYETRLYTSSPAGPIFALKNMGWSDKLSHEHSGPDGGPIPTQINIHLIKADGSPDDG